MSATPKTHEAAVRLFLDQCCIGGPTQRVTKEGLRQAFARWSEHSNVLTYIVGETFTKALRATRTYRIRPSRRRASDSGQQTQYYLGVSLRPDWESQLEDGAWNDWGY